MKYIVEFRLITSENEVPGLLKTQAFDECPPFNLNHFVLLGHNELYIIRDIIWGPPLLQDRGDFYVMLYIENKKDSQ